MPDFRRITLWGCCPVAKRGKRPAQGRAGLRDTRCNCLRHSNTPLRAQNASSGGPVPQPGAPAPRSLLRPVHRPCCRRRRRKRRTAPSRRPRLSLAPKQRRRLRLLKWQQNPSCSAASQRRPRQRWHPAASPPWLRQGLFRCCSGVIPGAMPAVSLLGETSELAQTVTATAPVAAEESYDHSGPKGIGATAARAVGPESSAPACR